MPEVVAKSAKLPDMPAHDRITAAEHPVVHIEVVDLVFLTSHKDRLPAVTASEHHTAMTGVLS
jgi:hypothetical protein